MKGKPKYNYGDKVKISLDKELVEGTIEIIDIYGTFEDSSDVSYDIMIKADRYKNEYNPEGKCLVKHIQEKHIISIE